jgi:glucose-1-phosphate thymidylyltransferase
MRGVLLAGGKGTRMGISSRAVNKHMNLVYDMPMVIYPLLNLKAAGIEDVMVITSEASSGQFMQLLGSGHIVGMNLTYRWQDMPLGIAHALSLCRKYSRHEPIVVILGDNFFYPHPTNAINTWNREGARVVVRITDKPWEFGTVKIDGGLPYGCGYKLYPQVDGDCVVGRYEGSYLGDPCDSVPLASKWYDYLPYNSIDEMLQSHPPVAIVEKPQKYIGNIMVTGLYMYDQEVWDIIDDLKPSSRGELEISSVNSTYLGYKLLDLYHYDGKWLDCGNPETLLEASNYVKEKGSWANHLS